MQYSRPPKRHFSRAFTQTNLILIAILGISIVMGFLSAFEDGTLQINGLAGNLATELFGGVLTFYLIDKIIRRNDDDVKMRDQLIREMENPDNGITKRAVGELRSHGWLQDGSLAGWFLQRANLEGVYLQDANVQGVGFYRCNLKYTKLKPEQLCKLNDLRFTEMPDGSMYDGRYCLTGDINWASEKYGLDLKTATVKQAADYYGVSEAQFIEGQQWAKNHLYDLCGRTPVLTAAAV